MLSRLHKLVMMDVKDSEWDDVREVVKVNDNADRALSDNSGNPSLQRGVSN